MAAANGEDCSSTKQTPANNSLDITAGARLSTRRSSTSSCSVSITQLVDTLRHSPTSDPTTACSASRSTSASGFLKADTTGCVGPYPTSSLILRGHSRPSRDSNCIFAAPTSRRRQLDESQSGESGKPNLGLKHGTLDGSQQPLQKESHFQPPRGSLLPIPEETSPFIPEGIAAREMAAMDRPWSGMSAGQSPTMGSWDDLISRKRGRGDSLGQATSSENAARRRAQSSAGYTAIDGQPTGPTHRRPQSSGGDFARERPTNGPGPTNGNQIPINPRTTVHHPDQRTSQGFAAQVAALNRRPSPLRAMRSSDSLPEMSPTKASFQDNNNYTINTRSKPETPQKGTMKRPTIYARPQRLSNGPRGTSAAETSEMSTPGTFRSFDSMAHQEGRMRAMSWAGMSPSEEHIPFHPFPQPTLPFRQSMPGWQRRPEMIKQTRLRSPGPDELFNELPREVLQLILDYLKRLHLDKGSSCATCWMRDCCSIAMCNKKWLQAAKEILYEDIQLVGPDSAQQKKKYKGVYSTRLVLLRRSLRTDPKLAERVRFLKVPALPDDAPIEAERYHDIVASVVMACPKLERLEGFYPTYNHSESRLFDALTSREKLKDMTWVIDATPTDHERKGHQSQSRPPRSKNRQSSFDESSSKLHSNPYNYLIAPLANQFVECHLNWRNLSHLTIHCLPGANLHTPNGLINVVLTYLTSLESLYLSHLSASSFDDNYLAALPRRLRKLSISHCPGITTAGLSMFAAQESAQDLETLTLIHQNVHSLPAILRIFSKLSKLTTFSLVQAMAPTLPDDICVWLMPYLASRSIKTLHWDIFESTLGETKADDILARSISANGFPSLRTLRAPCDPDGLFQSICKPQERVDLPGDRYRNGVVRQALTLGATRSSTFPNGNGNGNGNGKNQHGPKLSSSTHSYNSGSGGDFVGLSDFSDGRSSCSTNSKDSGMFLLVPTREAGSNLHQARRVAQARLEAARRFPRIEANVTDEDGVLVESSGLAGYLGCVTSCVNYSLSPDAGGSDERGGLVGVAELLGDGGEDLFGQGDAASRSGAGYGTGCVASAHIQAQALESKKTVDKRSGGKLSKNSSSSSNGGAGGKNAKDKDKIGKGGEAAKVKDGCTGKWNSYNNDTFTVDKKSGDISSHTERGRWRGPVELS